MLCQVFLPMSFTYPFLQSCQVVVTERSCLHFANEENETQRREGPCPRSHS